MVLVTSADDEVASFFPTVFSKVEEGFFAQGLSIIPCARSCYIT